MIKNKSLFALACVFLAIFIAQMFQPNPDVDSSLGWAWGAVGWAFLSLKK